MNETGIHKSIKNIKIGKIINLTNSEKSKINSLEYNDSFEIEKNNINAFPLHLKTNPNITDISHDFNKKANIKYIFNNYINDNNISNNYYKIREKESTKSFSENKIAQSDINIDSKNINKETRKKYKNIKLYINTKNSKPKIILNKKDINFNSNSNSNDKKMKLIKNLYFIKSQNQSINENNYNSINTLSIKHHITNESTKSSIFPKIPNKISRDRSDNIVDDLKIMNNSTFNYERFQNKNKYNEFMSIRKKYPFVLNPNPITPSIFIDLPKNIKRENKKNYTILKNENEKLFQQFFSIIPKEKFSKKFQNVGNAFKQKGNNNKDKLILIEENDDSLINPNIISGYKLLKDLNNKEKTINKKAIKLSKKSLYNKFKKCIIYLASKISNISIYITEVIKNYKKPKNSYFYPNSHDLFFAIKSKNIKLAEQILDSNKHLVLDFDYFGMTSLHWAAKYNCYQIIPKLFEYGSHIDAINYIGDTPLLISIKHNFMEATVFLLLYSASPFIKDLRGFNSIHYSKNDFKMNIIFKKVVSLHYASILGKTKNKFEFISARFSEYILNDYKNDLESEAYNLINSKYEFFKRKNNTK